MVGEFDEPGGLKHICVLEGSSAAVVVVPQVWRYDRFVSVKASAAATTAVGCFRHFLEIVILKTPCSATKSPPPGLLHREIWCMHEAHAGNSIQQPNIIPGSKFPKFQNSRFQNPKKQKNETDPTRPHNATESKMEDRYSPEHRTKVRTNIRFQQPKATSRGCKLPSTQRTRQKTPSLNISIIHRDRSAGVTKRKWRTNRNAAKIGYGGHSRRQHTYCFLLQRQSKHTSTHRNN